MSVTSDLVPTNIYEEAINNETTCDLSSRNLDTVPELNNNLLCVSYKLPILQYFFVNLSWINLIVLVVFQILYLQNNRIKSLPEDFFPSLPSLMWLDLRDNELTDIPKSIQNHPSLTHLLVQNNNLRSLPNELGTVNLKVLQLNGNPITYPAKEIIAAGVKKVLEYLNSKFIDGMFAQSQSDISEAASGIFPEGSNPDVVSYNSVIHGDKRKNAKTLSIQFNEKDADDSDDECYGKNKGKCPKLAKSRTQIPPYYQSCKYVAPPSSDSKEIQNQKIKDNYFKEITIKKHKEFVATRDKILQSRKYGRFQSGYHCTFSL